MSGPRENAVADCPNAGQLGHRWCGICPVHGVPRSQCGDNSTTSMGDPLSKLADGQDTYDAHATGSTASVNPELMRKAALRQAQERAARDGVRCLVWSKDGVWYVRTDAEGEVEGARLEWVEPAPTLGGFVLLQPMGGLYRITGGHLAGLPGLDQAIVWATREDALQAAEGSEICLHTSRQPTPELVFSDDRDGSGVPFRNNPERRRQNRGRAFRAVDDTTEGERAALEMIERALVEGCQGCGMIDPCGHHYEDCTLLEQGDILIDRATGKEVGQHEEAQ